VQKLVLLLIFLASQEEEAGMSDKESTMTLSMCQSWIMEGACSAIITTKETPSMMKFLSCIETTKEVASKAARASPKLGSHKGLI
jgi:hypothetical protein